MEKTQDDMTLDHDESNPNALSASEYLAIY